MHGCAANNAFSGPITSLFSAMRLDEKAFTCRCEKEDKKAYSNFAFLWVVFKSNHGREGVKLQINGPIFGSL